MVIYACTGMAQRLSSSTPASPLAMGMFVVMKMESVDLVNVITVDESLKFDAKIQRYK